jgi:16S rRNA G1207 methylase RsmC
LVTISLRARSGPPAQRNTHGIDAGVDAASRRISDKRQDATSTEECPICSGVDSLASDPGERFNVVMTNPPFGKKSNIADDLQTALEQFSTIAEKLKG